MISRRDFMKNTGLILSAAGIGLSAFDVVNRQKYKMGLQLFTIRDAMAADVLGTLKKIATIGYQDTETYGYDGGQNTYYGINATEFRKILEDNQLTTSSGHYDLAQYFHKTDDELQRYVDQCIVGAHDLGQSYITWPWLDPNSRSIESFKRLTDRLNKVGEQVTKAKLGFAYHNHDFEFIDHQGENGYDIILKNTDSKSVKLQIDLYWVAYSGINPHALFSRQPGRFVMWHIKDMHKVSRDYTELGNGSIDYTKILPDAALAGMQFYFIEQGGNFVKNSMESVTQSAAFFKKNLESYL